MRSLYVLKRTNSSRRLLTKRQNNKKNNGDDEDENEEEEEAEKTINEASNTSSASKKRQLLFNKSQVTSHHGQVKAKTLSLSDDVLSSMTRSFENTPVEDDHEEPGRLARLMDWSIDPDSALAFYWKAAITLTVIYNCTVVILRTAFAEMREEGVFAILDSACDILYLLDIFLESKTSFLDEGCMVTDTERTFYHYKQKPQFGNDLLSILPLHTTVVQVAYLCEKLEVVSYQVEVFWKYFSIYQPVLRLNRLLKCHAMDSYFQRTESLLVIDFSSRTNKPNLLRAFKLSIHLGLVIHWMACLYYMISEYEGLGSNDWVYPLENTANKFSKKYIMCMFWSTMTLTTIGERPPPSTELEYIFTGFTFLIGVFVFAAVVGNVGDVISNMNAARRDFQARMDQIKFYMDHRNVPDHLQNRIKRWAEYTWDRTKAIDEVNVLQFLPDRLKAEVAIHVHLNILKKVSIFEECEEGLLRELVLKLKSQIFSPGDYICRIGEIGREMYIINHGKVEILFPDMETGTERQIAVMHPGNFFGEISLLKLDDGQNKRTADVRAIGFSELLCLSRRDLMVALTEYPEAKRILEEYARQRFNNTRRLTPPETEDSRNTSPRLSCSSISKRSAKQIFSHVMRQEGFKHLLTTATKNTDLMEIKAAMEELIAAKNRTEENLTALQKKVQELEQLLLDKNLELQQSFAHTSYLEAIVKRFNHRQTVSGNCSTDTNFCTRNHLLPEMNLTFPWPNTSQTVSTIMHDMHGLTIQDKPSHLTSTNLFDTDNEQKGQPKQPRELTQNHWEQRRNSFQKLVQKKVDSKETPADSNSSNSSFACMQQRGNNDLDADDAKCETRKSEKETSSSPPSNFTPHRTSTPNQVSNMCLNSRTATQHSVSSMDSAVADSFSKSKTPDFSNQMHGSISIKSCTLSRNKHISTSVNPQLHRYKRSAPKKDTTSVVQMKNRHRDQLGTVGCKTKSSNSPKLQTVAPSVMSLSKSRITNRNSTLKSTKDACLISRQGMIIDGNKEDMPIVSDTSISINQSNITTINTSNDQVPDQDFPTTNSARPKSSTFPELTEMTAKLKQELISQRSESLEVVSPLFSSDDSSDFDDMSDLGSDSEETHEY